jgi:hypothetical protein
MLQAFRDPSHRQIYDSVLGIFFFGTPHQGLNVDDLKELVVALQEDQDTYELPQLLDQLHNDSEFLRNQQEDCIAMWQQFTGKICSFYETGKTETIVLSVGLPPPGPEDEVVDGASDTDIRRFRPVARPREVARKSRRFSDSRQCWE